jgi:RNA polymerase sigma factor (sigma-70 family)
MDLVREFACDNSETAFTELVRRHINLVYSVARRCTGTDGDAQDVTQAVFIILARKAAGLREKTLLTGWLYETTRFTAARLLRTNARRRAREQDAYMQSTLNEADSTAAWEKLSPHLEMAMDKLSTADRSLLVLRFYENKTAAETAALLGIREDAAHKRLTRAIEKLRKFFAQRGVAISAMAIAGAVSDNSVEAAPETLSKTISAVAISKGAAASLSTLTLVKAVTMKSAVAFGAGSIGGLFVTVGSAYVSLKARIDDSKSSRERQFMVRMFRVRAAVYLLWAAAYVIAAKCDLFQKPICVDFFAAAFVFYFFCIDLMILTREQGLRRRQIQIEDKTYVEAEWTTPRKVTDPAINAFNVKNMLKAFRFGIFRMILACTIWFLLGGGHALEGGWKVRSQHPAAEVCLYLTLAILVVTFAMSPYAQLLGWQKRPRFSPIRGDGPPPRGFVVFPIMFPILIGLMTLAVFTIHEHWANDGRHDSIILSPNEVLAFFGVVVAVYTAFTIRTIGILARRRKNYVGGA